MITFFYSEKEKTDKKEVMEVLTSNGWKKFTTMKRSESYELENDPDAKIVFMTLNDIEPFIKNSKDELINAIIYKCKLNWLKSKRYLKETEPVYYKLKHSDEFKEVKFIITSSNRFHGKMIVINENESRNKEIEIVSDSHLTVIMETLEKFANEHCVNTLPDKAKKDLELNRKINLPPNLFDDVDREMLREITRNVFNSPIKGPFGPSNIGITGVYIQDPRNQIQPVQGGDFMDFIDFLVHTYLDGPDDDSEEDSDDSDT